MNTRKNSTRMYLWREILMCFLLVFFAVSCACADGGEAGGDVLTWTLENGVLTVSGQGPMMNYSNNSATPWELRKLEIESVVIGEGVTSVGSYAFNGCRNLVSADLPDSVVSIGDCAFYECSLSNGINLPYGLESIGSYAFWECGFSALVIPDTVTSIGEYALAYASGTDYTLPAGITEIPMGLFMNSRVLATVTIPDGVTKIGNYAFDMCGYLTSVSLPGSLTEIGYQAFWRCGIKDITFRGTKVQAQAIVAAANNTVAGAATWHCTDGDMKGFSPMSGTCGDGLTWELEDGVMTITGQGPMTNYAYSIAPPWELRKLEIESLVIGEDVTSVGSYAFYGCRNLVSVDLPDSVASIGDSAFYECRLSNGIDLPYGLESIGSYAFWDCRLNALVFPDTVTSIGEYALAYASGTNYTLPSGITEIPMGLFMNSRVLATVTIPDGVTKIGNYAFDMCGYLTSVSLPGSLTEIGYQAFWRCGIKDITFRGTKVQAQAIVAAANNTVAGAATWHCTDGDMKGFSPMSGTCGDGLTWELEDGVMTITGQGPMTNYAYSIAPPWELRKLEIESLVIGEDVTSVGSYAFYGCRNLVSVDLPDSVASIGDSAFYECRLSNGIDLPYGLESIGSYAFWECGFSTLVIPDTVTSIGEYALAYASGTDYTLPSGITEIPMGLFMNSRILSTVTIPDGVTKIGNYAFDMCGYLTSVSLPASLTEIGYQVFWRCGINNVTFRGTKAQAQAIKTGLNNTYAGTATWHCIDGDLDGIGATSGTCGSNVTWAVDGGTLTVTGEGDMAEFTDLNPAPWTAFREDITWLEVGEGVTSVSAYAFRGMTKLATLTLPLSMERIEEGALAECAALADVYYAGSEEMAKMLPIGDGNEYLVQAHWHYRMDNEGNLESAVEWELTGTVLRIYGSGRMPDYNSQYPAPWHASAGTITSVVIESGVTHIGSYLFYGCTALESVSIAESVKTIGSYAFYGCTSLESVVVPSGVTSIGSDAFAGCTNLASVTLPAGKVTIGTYAFDGCRALTAITLPAGMTRIPECMLRNTGLTTLVIPEGVKTIAGSALSGCTALVSVSLPESLETVEWNAFNNTNVSQVTYGGELADAACVRLAIGNDRLAGALWHGSDTDGDYPLARSGELTSGLVWELDGNGTLTVSGSGAIPDYNDDFGAPWYYLRGEVTKIATGSGVQNIGSYAFRQMAQVTELELAEGLIAIEDYAFENCTALTAVTLPSTLRYLGEYAFRGCPARNSLDWMFENLYDQDPEYGEDPSTGSVVWTLEGGVLTVSGRGTMEGGDRPWYDRREEITSIVIQEGITGIWSGAFRNCVNAVSVTIPESVSYIGSSAFYGCTSLQSVVYGGTEATARKLVIGISNGPLVNAAWEWNGYTGSYPAETSGILSPDFEWSLDFNGTLVVSGEGAMPDCNYSFHAPWNKYASQIRHVVIEDGVKTIGAYAFTDFTNLVSVTIPNSVTAIGDGAFSNDPALATLEIPASVAEIGREAFCRSGLESITIPDTVVKIREYAFENCSKLTTLNLGLGLKAVPDGLCQNAYALESVTIPDNVKKIGMDAFWYCTKLEEISLPAGLEVIGSGAFRGCSLLADVEFRGTEAQAAGIRIGEGNEKLTGAAWTIPGAGGFPAGYGGQLTDTMSWSAGNGTLTISGSGVMPGYSYETPAPWYSLRGSISRVIVENGVTHIGSYAFYQMAGVTEVTIPNSVIRIGGSAFAYMSSLTAVTIPASVRSIGDYAFSYSGLTSVTIPDSVTAAAWGCFAGCRSMAEVTIGSGLRELKGDMFWDCDNLTAVTVPDGIAIIRSGTFGSCNGLASVSLPEGLTEIESGAFRNCSVLADVTFRGTATKAAAIRIGNNNEKLTDATWHFADGSSGDYPAATSGALTATVRWSIENGVLTISGRGMMPSFGGEEEAMGGTPWQAHAGSIRKVIVESGIRNVGDSAFRSLPELTEVELASTVTGIGYYAFRDELKLKQITIPAGVTTIDGGAFMNTGLESVSLPDSVTSLGYGVFEACDSLTAVRLPAGLARIPESTFWSADNLERIVIPEGITAIGNSAFAYCRKLEYVELPESLVFIEGDAFIDCTRLARVKYHDTEDAAFYLEIDSGNAPLLDAVWQYKPVDPIIGLTSVLRLPAGLKVIDAEAFAGTGAEAVVIPDEVESIGNSAFAGSATLQYVRIPESVKVIGDGAIPQGVTVVCEAGGDIETWCEANEILHVSLWE